MSAEVTFIRGMRNRGYSMADIADQLGWPIHQVEATLRTAGRPICLDTGKRCYASEKAARRSMAKASNKVRVYRCDFGAHYHVTSWADGYGGQK